MVTWVRRLTVASRRCQLRFQDRERTTLARTWWPMVSHMRSVLSRQNIGDSSNFFSRRVFFLRRGARCSVAHPRSELIGAVYRVSPGVLDVVVAGSIVVLLAPDTMSTFAARRHVGEGSDGLRSVAEAAGMHVSDVQKKRDLMH